MGGEGERGKEEHWEMGDMSDQQGVSHGGDHKS